MLTLSVDQQEAINEVALVCTCGRRPVDDILGMCPVCWEKFWLEGGE